jgi:hypothetical protein
MPPIYNDATLKLIWDMIENEKVTRRKAAETLCTTPEKIDLIYAAARRRYYTRPNKRPAIVRQLPSELRKLERPKAVYSNHSPMGIAY